MNWSSPIQKIMMWWVTYYANEYIDRKTIAGASVFALFKGKEAVVISKQLCCNKVVDNFPVISIKVSIISATSGVS